MEIEWRGWRQFSRDSFSPSNPQFRRGRIHPLPCSLKRGHRAYFLKPPVKSRRDLVAPRISWPLDNEQFAHHFSAFCVFPPHRRVPIRPTCVLLEGSPAGRRMFVRLFFGSGLYLVALAANLAGNLNAGHRRWYMNQKDGIINWDSLHNSTSSVETSFQVSIE